MEVRYDFVTGNGSPLYEAAMSIGDFEIAVRGKTYSDAHASLMLHLSEHARRVARTIEHARASDIPKTPGENVWDSGPYVVSLDPVEDGEAAR